MDGKSDSYKIVFYKVVEILPVTETWLLKSANSKTPDNRGIRKVFFLFLL